MKKIHFEWNSRKDRENQEKHGVAFATAQYAFGDPDRVIAEDVSHSRAEEHYYCFGKVADGILRSPLHLPQRCYSHHRGGLLAKGKEHL